MSIHNEVNVTVMPVGCEMAHSYYDNEMGLQRIGNNGRYVMKICTYHTPKYKMLVFREHKIAIESQFDNAQDAWDAGIALMLMGAHNE